MSVIADPNCCHCPRLFPVHAFVPEPRLCQPSPGQGSQALSYTVASCHGLWPWHSGGALSKRNEQSEKLQGSMCWPSHHRQCSSPKTGSRMGTGWVLCGCSLIQLYGGIKDVAQNLLFRSDNFSVNVELCSLSNFTTSPSPKAAPCCPQIATPHSHLQPEGNHSIYFLSW